MFHRIIFLLLIVSRLSCDFNRCADYFQPFSEHRLQEYSKCCALNHFKIKNKRNKFFIMLERNSVNVHSNSRHSSHYKSENWMAVQVILEIFFNGLAKSPRVLPSSLVQFVLQNCEILLSVQDLYDSNSASQYCFTSDVMYKWNKKLVYTHPYLLGRFCKVNLSNAQKFGLIFFPGLINLQ